MDQVASFRAGQLAHFIDKVQPRENLYREVLTSGGFTLSDEQFTDLRLNCWKLSQLIRRCYVESWDYGAPEQQTEEEAKQDLRLGNAFPENKYGAPEQQTEEQAEHGIDLLLLELLTYEERPALVLMLLPFGDVGEIYGGKALKPYYKLARELYPEVFERYLAREEIQEELGKQAD